MKKFMCHYPLAFFSKGDVVYDENFHLLLVVTHVMRNPTLPIFKGIATENYTADIYVGREMPTTYSTVTKSLRYVCKKSSLSRFCRNSCSSINPRTNLFRFLWNFETLRSCQK